MKSKLLVGTGITVALVGGLFLQTLHSGGAFKTIEPHFAGSCTRVDGVVGAEDITIDPDTGIAYISAMDRRKLAATGEHDGGIYIYLPGTYEMPAKLVSDYEGPFHPHGISLWKAPANSGLYDRLFVVNHPPVTENSNAPGTQTSQIDIFDIYGLILRHVATVEAAEPISLNDVAAVGPNQFYASIDQGSTTGLGRTMEVYGRLARAGVLHGKDGETSKVLGDLIYANGVQTNADGNILYVAETTGKRLSSYRINAATGALDFLSDIEIDSGLDNIERDENGNLWLVSHPKTFDFLAHASDAENRSPSQVFVVQDQDGTFSATEIYLNDGNPISGASVAAPAGNHFLVGSVFEPFILDCTF